VINRSSPVDWCSHADEEQGTAPKVRRVAGHWKISPETYEKWNRETGSARLPERLHPKAKPKRRRTAKPTAKRKRR
jgi:hypothetical protein